jgi:peptidoglycan L-alanyl-D-glutamate endopeptidase CwlK
LDDLIEIYDNSVVWGYRGEIDQNLSFDSGNSKAMVPRSAHNRMPSRAMDTIPYPEQWRATREQFMYMQGLIRGIAHKRGIKLKPLIEWDLAHTELED